MLIDYRIFTLLRHVELLFYYHSWKFQICMPSCSFYWSPDAYNRMCEPCTFPKSGHIYSYHKQGMFILQGNSFMYVSHKHHYVYWQKSLSFCTYTSTVMLYYYTCNWHKTCTICSHAFALIGDSQYMQRKSQDFGTYTRLM